MDQSESSEQTIARLTGELAAANKTIADFKAQANQAQADEIVIRKKMEVGLSRQQAAAVLDRQRKFEAAEKSNSNPAAA